MPSNELADPKYMRFRASAFGATFFIEICTRMIPVVLFLLWVFVRLFDRKVCENWGSLCEGPHKFVGGF